MNSRLLLLVQSHTHSAALMGCIPHIRANYGWCWVVYSPAVLADPALVEREFDQQIADLTRAMKECYGREDGAGGDAYKAKRDAAILEKSAKVKEAWRSLTPEAQIAAEDRIFRDFFEAKACPNISITKHPDHFEVAASVEMLNSLKAGMKPGFTPGEYVVAWPTSLPNGDGYKGQVRLTKIADADIPEAKFLPGDAEAAQPSVHTEAPPTPPTATKIDKRTKRYKELMMMDLDMLGPIGFELGLGAHDPVMGKKDALIEAICLRELAKAL